MELIWDQMYRSTLHYGRKGLALYAYNIIQPVIIVMQGPRGIEAISQREIL